MRIAILGGTFDPVHIGHLLAAETVARTFGVDEVHFIPAFTPPHKPGSGITSAFHRCAMVALAIAPFDRFRLSTIELDQLGRCYTVNTLERIHDAIPGAALLFIVGTDLYSEIDGWKDHERLFELASFAVVNRPGFPMRRDLRAVEVVRSSPEHPLDGRPRVYYLPRPEENISSTRLREQMEAGVDTTRWIPPSVRAYIVNHKLYS